MPLLAPFQSTSVAPPVVAPPAVPRFQRVRMWWTGWNGDEWEITDPRSGVFLTQGGTRGLDAPTPEPWTSSSPALDGAWYRGERVPERECFWPLYVFSDRSSAEWLERDRALWRSLRRGKVGTWTVQTPDGERRTLPVRFAEVDQGMDRDPVAFGWRLYGIRLMAYQPYWLGGVVSRSFTNEAPVPFYASEHASPDPGALFYVSSGSTLSAAEIDNPGDVDQSPLFVLDGPWDAGASVGVGSSVTTYGAAIAEGQSVVVDTRAGRLGAKRIPTTAATPGTPEWMAALDAPGVDVFTSLTALALDLQVPAGETEPLAISATGQGAVHVALQPLYERAW